MAAFSQLDALRAGLPYAGVMQIGAARLALLREIARETGQPHHLPAPTPRLTLAALAVAGLACIMLLLLVIGIVPRPH